jgi:hypothetical protein
MPNLKNNTTATFCHELWALQLSQASHPVLFLLASSPVSSDELVNHSILMGESQPSRPGVAFLQHLFTILIHATPLPSTAVSEPGSPAFN